MIYVTTGLMDIIESKEELDMVLAHEVAHIEERHAMNEFQSSREPLYENDPLYVANRLNEFGRSLVLVGYTDAHEREADFYALAYGMHRYGVDHTSLSLVLQKLQDIQWRDIRVGGGLFSGRSNLEGRIQALRETRVQAFQPKATYYRRRDNGPSDARISLLFQKLYHGQVTLYTSIESEETFPFNSQGRGQIVIETTENKTYILDQDNISFIRKPPEGMEYETDHHTYVIAFEKGGEERPLPITRDSIRRITLTKSQTPLSSQPIAVFVP
ncbi:MAG: hypothetical protein A2Z06_03070 [Candidatus Glassbacteria bacterium RBG_16_58_8]|uniref:Peptidase M48 domain-containing protein n=1 Tax=Candidatus Glassbacteria bacterium RBG_16_58_8 TaxID=1817866 RepID=A0A1F5YDL5_9BACT|nr:MAG: hypothetical protein A2Z06_03070 [Candidatus Glassbacteria bacterium RBG_16_58_8]